MMMQQVKRLQHIFGGLKLNIWAAAQKIAGMTNAKKLLKNLLI